MYSRIRNIPAPEGTLVATPQRVFLVSLVMLAVSYAVYAQAIMTSDQLNLPQGPPVGGDFVAFWGSARAVMDGMAADIYQPAAYEAYLMDNAMPRERFGLTWQYPPTYYFFILPLALLPFMPGYVLWTGGTFAMFLATMRGSLKLPWTGVLLIAAIPVCFNAVITGQNGFLTATLLVVAAAMPDKRPILAGICAGLLTFKPQLGVLLPFAYLAAGCWRAFFTAGITAVLLFAASVGAFGWETWEAFFHGLAGVGDGVSRSIYPLQKMPTVFAALAKSGVPREAAMALQLVSLIAAVGLVSWTWRRIRDSEMRAAILCACVFLCTPYAYYYEMTILVFPAVVLVRRAMQSGLMRLEEAGLIALWALPIFLPGLSKYAGAQLWLATVLILLALLIRRALPELMPEPRQTGNVAA
ncbi:glycosyltransferase family 87 protein [Aquisalinus flavus]|uniref:DUF2029 domain-containing protein n=1 Tax=Aquisalinus flavus TaxID=1526572 RepID=A0A8J2V6E3_9PROT|nr:glycosyltransferase family 87 protein [Aquisalinus flavus]MBD0425304.1 DUF2029 domain-containing protein [Aquisalinus flavus]UNE49043.1 DUF2029 domain-containing protein [Aquisalinus flavus]GGD17135.1 hypothetical protein GCM10011342_27400 [Aquisalinus flavus]